MKIGGIATLALLPAYVFAFTDTAPLYSSEQLGKFGYYEEASDLVESWTQWTNKICTSDAKAVIFRVNNLKHHGSHKKGTYIEHVHYRSANDLELGLDQACSEKVSYQQDAKTISKQLTFVDIEDGGLHSVDEYINSWQDPLVTVVVQGKPSFVRPGSHVDEIKNYVEDKIYQKLNIELGLKHKRSEAEDYDEIAAEVEADFAKAEELVAQHNDQVTAVEKDATESPEPSHKPAKNLSLFTEYRFFTPGIWLGLIVSALLISVLVTALLWISSLEISYKSFDKQVDYEKKNE